MPETSPIPPESPDAFIGRFAGQEDAIKQMGRSRIGQRFAYHTGRSGGHRDREAAANALREIATSGNGPLETGSVSSYQDMLLLMTTDPQKAKKLYRIYKALAGTGGNSEIPQALREAATTGVSSYQEARKTLNTAVVQSLDTVGADRLNPKVFEEASATAVIQAFTDGTTSARQAIFANASPELRSTIETDHQELLLDAFTEGTPKGRAAIFANASPELRSTIETDHPRLLLDAFKKGSGSVRKTLIQHASPRFRLKMHSGSTVSKTAMEAIRATEGLTRSETRTEVGIVKALNGWELQKVQAYQRDHLAVVSGTTAGGETYRVQIAWDGTGHQEKSEETRNLTEQRFQWAVAFGQDAVNKLSSKPVSPKEAAKAFREAFVHVFNLDYSKYEAANQAGNEAKDRKQDPLEAFTKAEKNYSSSEKESSKPKTYGGKPVMIVSVGDRAFFCSQEDRGQSGNGDGGALILSPVNGALRILTERDLDTNINLASGDEIVLFPDGVLDGLCDGTLHKLSEAVNNKISPQQREQFETAAVEQMRVSYLTAEATGVGHQLQNYAQLATTTDPKVRKELEGKIAENKEKWPSLAGAELDLWCQTVAMETLSAALTDEQTIVEATVDRTPCNIVQDSGFQVGNPIEKGDGSRLYPVTDGDGTGYELPARQTDDNEWMVEINAENAKKLGTDAGSFPISQVTVGNSTSQRIVITRCTEFKLGEGGSATTHQRIMRNDPTGYVSRLTRVLSTNLIYEATASTEERLPMPQGLESLEIDYTKLGKMIIPFDQESAKARVPVVLQGMIDQHLHRSVEEQMQSWDKNNPSTASAVRRNQTVTYLNQGMEAILSKPGSVISGFLDQLEQKEDLPDFSSIYNSGYVGADKERERAYAEYALRHDILGAAALPSNCDNYSPETMEVITDSILAYCAVQGSRHRHQRFFDDLSLVHTTHQSKATPLPKKANTTKKQKKTDRAIASWISRIESNLQDGGRAIKEVKDPTLRLRLAAYYSAFHGKSKKLVKVEANSLQEAIKNHKKSNDSARLGLFWDRETQQPFIIRGNEAGPLTLSYPEKGKQQFELILGDNILIASKFEALRDQLTQPS